MFLQKKETSVDNCNQEPLTFQRVITITKSRIRLILYVTVFSTLFFGLLGYFTTPVFRLERKIVTNNYSGYQNLLEAYGKLAASQFMACINSKSCSIFFRTERLLENYFNIQKIKDSYLKSEKDSKSLSWGILGLQKKSSLNTDKGSNFKTPNINDILSDTRHTVVLKALSVSLKSDILASNEYNEFVKVNKFDDKQLNLFRQDFLYQTRIYLNGDSDWYATIVIDTHNELVNDFLMNQFISKIHDAVIDNFLYGFENVRNEAVQYLNIKLSLVSTASQIITNKKTLAEIKKQQAIFQEMKRELDKLSIDKNKIFLFHAANEPSSKNVKIKPSVVVFTVFGFLLGLMLSVLTALFLKEKSKE